jgi:hypothetical protein
MRYVVLHHTGVEKPHFDLMFESTDGEALTTLRCSMWPITDTTHLQRLPDHRRAYLEYEGPVSGGRGEVRRIASGTCAVERQWLIFETGQRIRLPEHGDAGA